ncbi:hypothetical protein ACTXT7_000292 [Hymenolepis weldensis]
MWRKQKAWLNIVHIIPFGEFLFAEAKALAAKFEGSKLVDSSTTSKSFPSSYSIKPSASVEICDPAAAEDITINVPEFIYEPKSSKFSESRTLIEKPNVVQQEMVREGIKMANLMRDSAFVHSDADPTRLVYEKSASMLQSAKFLAQPNASN